MKFENGKNLIFIVGSYRSGTTLLRNIIDLSEKIAVTPELRFFDLLVDKRHCFGTINSAENKKKLVRFIINKIKSKKNERNAGELREGIEIDFSYLKNELLRQRNYKGMYLTLIKNINTNNQSEFIIEKTPVNIFFLNKIYSYFPEAKVINIIRDGREVIASAHKGLKVDIFDAMARWTKSINSFRNFKKKNKNNFLEIKYKEIANNPMVCSKKIFHFLGFKKLPKDFESNLKNLPQTSFFKNDNKGLVVSKNFFNYFSIKKQDIINSLIHKKLLKLGYRVDSSKIKKPKIKYKIKFFYARIKLFLYFEFKKAGYSHIYFRIKDVLSRLVFLKKIFKK